MRKSFIPRAVAAALLVPAVVGIAATQPVHAAAGRTHLPAGPCQTGPRDTTGSCSVVNTHVTIHFPACRPPYVSCRPVILHTATPSVYPLGLVVLIPHWGKSHNSIQTGDRVSARVNKQGLIAFTVTTRLGKVRTRFAPVIVIAPRGYKYLWVLTTHGWKHVARWKRVAGGYTVTQPGVYKWTRR